jgi:inosose dehydratase
MRLATAPVNWNNPDVPEYRAWVPYGQMMDEFVAAGYDACEWGSNMPSDPASLSAELHGRGLTMVGAFVGLALRDPAKRQAELERALTTARFLKATGGTHLIAADSGDDRRRTEAGHVDPAGGLSDAAWKSLGTGLNELGEALEPMGMRLVFHNHVGTYVETPGETARLLEVTDPKRVGWCLDCGHLAYGGGDSLEMLERYGDRVGHVHIKDVDGAILARAQAEGWSFAEALKSFIFPPLGEGIARIPMVVDALRSHGYDGWYVIEQDTTAGDPLETARQNREYLEALLASPAPAR